MYIVKASFPSEAFIVRTIGHSFVFFILTFTLYLVFSSILLSVAYSYIYAMLMEFLQLLFMRDGRIFDVGFDSMGIFAAVLFAALGRRFLKTINEMKMNT